MPDKLRYLLVEDMESDAKLLAFMLKRGGYNPDYERVDTEESFTRGLEKGGWDLVIADYNLPLFSGMEALRLFKESGLDIPFILVSGAVEEEIAVDALLAGAHDFIVKGKWGRLVPAIQREIKEAGVREANRIKEETLRTLYELNQMKDVRDKDMADFALDKGVALTGSRFGFLGFLKEGGVALDVHAWSRDAMKECAVEDVSIHFPLDKAGLWAEAVRQGKPLVVNDYPSLPQGKKGFPEGHVPLSNLLVVPLFERETAVAIIAVGNKTRDYRDGDIRQLTLLLEGVWRLKKEREAEREIKELNQRMEFILGVTNTGIDIIDADYNIRYIDPAWARSYGDPSGKKCFDYFMGRDKPCPDCGIRKALKTKTTTVKEQILVKEGNRPIQVTTVPFQDEEGNWLVAEANVDITERKKAQDALRQSLHEKEVLLREIHHRVKNNLQIVSGLISLQSRATEDERLRDIFQQCQNRIGVMAFIHEKLCHSKSLTQIEFRDFIQSLASFICETYPRDKQKIVFIFETQGVYFGIDTAIPCGLIINELISNVIHHAFVGKGEGRVKISLEKVIKKSGDGEEKAETEYELTVADDGVGLPEGMDIRKARTMGLYLVSNLIEKQLRGVVELDRSRGTEFKIRFKERKYKERV